MSQDDLRYEAMVEGALRGVVRQALEVASSQGLPGEHHFYITFRTDAPGVTIPARLKERYPTEMTIVIQYQFWNLEVGEDSFGVTLSFNDKKERLSIPLAAVTAFADPSVRFGLQFDSGGEDTGEEGGEEPGEGAAVTDLSFDESKAEAAKAETAKGAAKRRDRTAAAQESDKSAGQEPAGKVVTLDAFRKK